MFSLRSPPVLAAVLFLLSACDHPAAATTIPSDMNINSTLLFLTTATVSRLPSPTIRDGLNGHPCKSNGDCTGPRKCLASLDASVALCPASGGDCVCFGTDLGKVTCDKSEDCDKGERCYKIKNQGICISCKLKAPDGDDGQSFTPVDSGRCDGTAPCIGVHHLVALAKHDLVFPAHRVADVLCDQMGSCATAGHIVVYQGRTLRMGSYCTEHAKCDARIMEVNSPRMRRGMRVGSATSGLEFTALSAKFETTMEEYLMRALVRLGA